MSLNTINWNPISNHSDIQTRLNIIDYTMNIEIYYNYNNNTYLSNKDNMIGVKCQITN